MGERAIFTASSQVRMYDTDAAGILYFASQFRFAHDAIEGFMSELGVSFQTLSKEKKFTFVVVHAEADYFFPLVVGDVLDVQLIVESIGTTSFTLFSQIFKKNQTLVGTVKTVHVTLDKESKKKIPIPQELRKSIEKYISKARKEKFNENF